MTPKGAARPVPRGYGSANSKIVRVNNNMGAKGIQNMQGTTRIIYDSIKLNATTGNTIITFFQNVRTRQFPFTNLTENKLQVGESIAVERYSLSIIQTEPGTDVVLGQSALAYNPTFNRLYRSDLSFQIAQDTVIKNNPNQSMKAEFNRHAKFADISGYLSTGGVDRLLQTSHDLFHMDNPLVIPPMIEFTCTLQVPKIDLPVYPGDYHLCLTLEGLGSLYAPKSTY